MRAKRAPKTAPSNQPKSSTANRRTRSSAAKLPDSETIETTEMIEPDAHKTKSSEEQLLEDGSELTEVEETIPAVENGEQNDNVNDDN